MHFSDALTLIKKRYRLTRTAWCDPNFSVSFSDRGNIVTSAPEKPKQLYLPNQDDLLANDWELAR